jgi:hypothetical protein
MQIKPCQSYHAVLTDQMLLRGTDIKSAFKVYFISITGRAEPARYEWPHDKTARDRFAGLFRQNKFEGVGFVTAFPHITKLFRFDPAAETVLNVRAFKTSDLSQIDMARAEDYLEFACYAEALLAAAEYRLWAKAKTVMEYLSEFSSFDNGKIVSNTKLADHFSPTGL